MLINNVLLGSLLGYPITPSLLCALGFLFLSIPDLLRGNRLRSRVLAPCSALIAYEFLLHGIAMGGFFDIEWCKSFALLVLCVILLVSSVRTRLLPEGRMVLVRTVNFAAVLMGGAGLFQFVTANLTGVNLSFLPEAWQVSTIDPFSDFFRFAGLVRAKGISYESSYYGAGMLVLTVVSLTLFFGGPPKSRFRSVMHAFALLMGLVGILVSVSFAVWGVLAVIIAVVFFEGIILSRRRWVAWSGLVAALLIAGFLLALWPYLSGRFESVTLGQDNSFRDRVVNSIKLIIRPHNDPLLSLVGSGVGTEQEAERVAVVFSSESNLMKAERLIVNGWAYLAVTMGWVGLLIHAWLLWGVFEGHWRNSRTVVLMLAMLLVGYFFINARYLSPEWWAMLILTTQLIGAARSPRLVSQARVADW